MRHSVLTFVCAMAMTSLVTVHAQEFRLSSTDLDIPSGYTVIVDGKQKGTAPLRIALRLSVRHKVMTEVSGMRVREFYLTAKDVGKSKEIESIPAWFVNPTMHQSDFAGHTRLTPATAFAPTIQLALEEAQSAANSKLSKGMINQYNTIRESPRNLDSSSASYYPNLTRGQMDSLNDVNGGKMVLQSLPAASAVEFLEYEVQQIGEEYRVYVLAGRR